MTSFIIPTIFLATLSFWVQKLPNVYRETAVFKYKLRYYWRRLLVSIQSSGIEQLEDGVVIVDKAHRVVDVNAMVERLMGQTAVCLIGQPITAICPNIENKFEQAAGGKIEVVRDTVAAARTFEIALKPITNWRKKPKGYILIITDITERKGVENMQRDMTHTLVHDLRAPLSNSIFALQMLEMHLNGSATPETTQMIDMTISNTEKVLDRINKILDVARLDSSQMPLALSSVSLCNVIGDVLEAQASRIAEKKLHVITYVPDSLAFVWADGNILERILQNLVDNSIKFTLAGGEILITATAVPESEPPTVHITVADSGSGIPFQLQQTIFDKYSGTTEKGSSGLGLAFCKMALAAHGQNIWVESEPQQGASFTISLALITQPHNQHSQPA